MDTLRVLALGDIVGRMGREAVLKVLPQVRQEEKIDLVVAQAENLAHGIGVTEVTLNEVRSAGIDVFTGGNHIFQKQGLTLVEDPSMRLLRPANYEHKPGTGWTVFEIAGVKVALINLIGQVFMKDQVSNPFVLLNSILESVPKDVRIRLLDFHAEATSEKVAMGWHAEGRLSAVWGTHTQVPTADARVLPQGTGFVTDLGMSGARDSVIGVEKEGIVRAFLEGKAGGHVMPDTGVAVVQGVVFEIAVANGTCVSANRIDRQVQIG